MTKEELFHDSVRRFLGFDPSEHQYFGFINPEGTRSIKMCKDGEKVRIIEMEVINGSGKVDCDITLPYDYMRAKYEPIISGSPRIVPEPIKCGGGAGDTVYPNRDNAWLIAENHKHYALPVEYLCEDGSRVKISETLYKGKMAMSIMMTWSGGVTIYNVEVRPLYAPPNPQTF